MFTSKMKTASVLASVVVIMSMIAWASGVFTKDEVDMFMAFISMPTSIALLPFWVQWIHVFKDLGREGQDATLTAMIGVCLFVNTWIIVVLWQVLSEKVRGLSWPKWGVSSR